MRLRRIALASTALALASLPFAGCAIFGESRPEDANVQNEHWLSRAIVHTIHVRRPEGTPVDPRAYPWDATYRASPLPDPRFNCAELGAMNRGMNLQALRACLKSVPPGTSVIYRLVRGAHPELVLEYEPPAVPPCLVEQLPRIPVPREIVFQSAEEGTLSCYASRVDDSTGLGSDLADALSTNRLALQLNFPLREFPKDDVKTSQWLISLALTPFLRDSGILGRLVADRPCQACIGERLFVRARDGRSETWPVDELPPSMQNAFDENAGSVAQGDDDELTKVQDSDDVQMTVIGW